MGIDNNEDYEENIEWDRFGEDEYRWLYDSQGTKRDWESKEAL